MAHKRNNPSTQVANPSQVANPQPTESAHDSTPTPVIPQEDYTLECIIKGYQKFDGDRWHYHKVATHLIRFDMRTDEGGKIDEHIPLSVGSTLDEVESLTVRYIAHGVFAHVRAVRMTTPEKHWVVLGSDSDGKVVEEHTLMTTVKDDKGIESQIAWNSKSDTTSCRFLVRDLMNQVRKLTWVKAVDTANPLKNLLSSKITCESGLQKLAIKYATTPTPEILKLIDEATQKLLKIESDIEALKSPTPTPDIAAILAAARARVATPTATPTVEATPTA